MNWLAQLWHGLTGYYRVGNPPVVPIASVTVPSGSDLVAIKLPPQPGGATDTPTEYRPLVVGVTSTTCTTLGNTACTINGEFTAITYGSASKPTPVPSLPTPAEWERFMTKRRKAIEKRDRTKKIAKASKKRNR